MGDDEKAEVILQMLTKEAQKKRWQGVNYSSKKPRGQSVLAVKVKLPDEMVEETKTADEVFHTMSSHPSEHLARVQVSHVLRQDI